MPKKLGFPKLAKFSISIVTVLIVGYAIYIVTYEREYNKDVVIEQLEKQNIVLLDSFSIDKHHYEFGPRDYLEWFELSISKRDKNNIIAQIRNSSYYNEGEDGCEGFIVPYLRYSEKEKEVCNCEIDKFVISYVCPIYDNRKYCDIMIKVSKNENKLFYREDKR